MTKLKKVLVLLCLVAFVLSATGCSSDKPLIAGSGDGAGTGIAETADDLDNWVDEVGPAIKQMAASIYRLLGMGAEIVPPMPGYNAEEIEKKRQEILNQNPITPAPAKSENKSSGSATQTPDPNVGGGTGGTK